MSEKDLDLLNTVISKAVGQGADAADAVLFDSATLEVSFRKGEPEDIERAESQAIGLRVFVGEKNAIVTSTDLLADTLNELTERAVAMARASTDDPYSHLAPEERLVQDVPELELYDGREPEPETLTEMCREAEDAALAHEGITNSEGSSASYGGTRISLATSQGFSRQYRTSSCGLSLSVIAGQGSGMERDYAYGHTRHWEDLQSPASIGNEAAERTLRRLNPQKVATRSMPLVFDPRVGRSLLGNFASAISGSAIARGTSFLKESLHQPVFGEHITITDDPHRLRGLGSKPFDGEGIANTRRDIVAKGSLTTWLMDTRSAKQLGLQSTGHAARSASAPPHPSSSNLFMQPGEQSVNELISDIKEGIFITDTFGMGVNLITGDYSQGASGIWIENGELAYPVSEITIAGHLRDMFQRCVPANDLAFNYATNAPTLRIDGMTVAGI